MGDWPTPRFGKVSRWRAPRRRVAETFPRGPARGDASRTFAMSPPSAPGDAGLEENNDEIRFVWIDLEMTGLNPDVDRILEIAVVITGPDLRPLGELQRVIQQPEFTTEKMSKVVQQMHTRNGLIEE